MSKSQTTTLTIGKTVRVYFNNDSYIGGKVIDIEYEEGNPKFVWLEVGINKARVRINIDLASRITELP